MLHCVQIHKIAVLHHKNMPKRLAGYGSHLDLWHIQVFWWGYQGRIQDFWKGGFICVKGFALQICQIWKKIIDLSSLAKHNLAVSNN